METNCKLIGIALMSTLLIFGQACDLALAGKFPAIAEPAYPDSLNLVRGFHDEFAKPGPSLRLGIFTPDDLTRSDAFDSSLSDLAGFSFFGDSEEKETFQGVVAINTEKSNIVTGKGQFKGIPTDVNYMDIDVRDIIVISINTARGGSAIATSEIFIEPVQHGFCPS